MALYSVWDWDRNAWRVYATKAAASVGDDPVPPRPVNVSPIGADPDMDVKPLPAGAKFVGFDLICRGEVRRLPAGPLGDDAGSSPSSGWGMFAIGAALATAFWVWRGRS